MLYSDLSIDLSWSNSNFLFTADCINIFHALLTFLTDVRKKKESELAILLSDIQGWSGTVRSFTFSLFEIGINWGNMNQESIDGRPPLNSTI